MTTPLFMELGGRSKLESLLMQVSGDSEGRREVIHVELINDSVASTTPGHWDPEKHGEIEAAGKNRSLVLWSGDVKYAFVPGPKCFGRMVTLHSCWVPPGHAMPDTEAKFRQMPGYEVSVFGGTSDPAFNRGWRSIPFSTSRHRVIISNTLKVASPMRLAWWLDAADVAASGGKQGTGALFFLRIDGQVEVFGQYQ